MVATAPERSAHVLTKAQIWRRMAEAGGMPCQVYPDWMAVEVDERTVYEPDALLRCGTPLPADAIKLNDPVTIVEVLSPSARARDAGIILTRIVREGPLLLNPPGATLTDCFPREGESG